MLVYEKAELMEDCNGNKYWFIQAQTEDKNQDLLLGESIELFPHLFEIGTTIEIRND